MRERGSALLIAVVSVTVLLLISGIFFSLVNDQMKSNSYEEKAIKSYYLAQAGVFYGIAKIKATTVPTPDGTGKSTQAPILNPFGYGGQFNVDWQISQDGQYYTITGTGSFGSGANGQVNRNIQAYYKIGSAGASGEIISQSLLNVGEVGQGNTEFRFCNTYPLDDTLPVKVSQPIYIYTINHGGHTIVGNSQARNVRLSLRNSSNQTMPIDTSLARDMTQPTKYLYIISDFQGVTGVTPDTSEPPESYSITYTGNETVHLVVEGYITRNDQPPDANDGTGTITNNFVVSPDSGLIWQVEK